LKSPAAGRLPLEVNIMPEVEYPVVLVVDDEPGIRNIAQIALQHDFAVLLAEDGVRALEMAYQFPGKIHLLVSDLRMPRMGGLEAVRRILLEHPETHVLLMSGEPAASLPAEGRRYPFIAKPFTLPAFRSAVNGALSGGLLSVRRALQQYGHVRDQERKGASR